MKLELNPNQAQRGEAIRLLIKLLGGADSPNWQQSLRGANETQNIATIIDGEKVIAAAIYETAEQEDDEETGNKQKRVCLIRSMQGNSNDTGIEWLPFLDEFEKHLASIGITEVVIHGRYAWARLSKHGWKPIFVAVKKHLAQPEKTK